MARQEWQVAVVTTLMLVLLTPAAYYIGRYIQWSQDAKRAMGSWREKQRR